MIIFLLCVIVLAIIAPDFVGALIVLALFLAFWGLVLGVIGIGLWAMFA